MPAAEIALLVQAVQDEDAPWWVLLIALGAVLVIIVALSSSRRDRNGGAPPSANRQRAQRAYADSRWLEDHFDESLAIWRGEQLAGMADDGNDSANAVTWSQLGSRVNRASDALYSMEALAANPGEAETARGVVEALNTTRRALDARAEAHFAYLEASAESAAGENTTELVAGRDREIRASNALATARADLADAVRGLGKLT